MKKCRQDVETVSREYSIEFERFPKILKNPVEKSMGEIFILKIDFSSILEFFFFEFLFNAACEFVTNEGLAAIATLPNLHHLVISYVTSITDEGLVGMHNLRTLECHRCVTLKDAGVSSLIEVAPNLELLDLSGCPITNSTLEVAIKATKRRRNNTILKMVIGDTLTNLAEVTEVSPLLQIVNVCLDREIREKNIFNGGLLDLVGLYF